MSRKRPSRESQDQNSLEEEFARLQAENEALREEVEALQFELDVEACHAAGLAAQLRALIAESEACPHKDGHPLVQRVEFAHSRTGEAMLKTRSYPLYREAFDAEAAERGLEDPEELRA